MINYNKTKLTTSWSTRSGEPHRISKIIQACYPQALSSILPLPLPNLSNELILPVRLSSALTVLLIAIITLGISGQRLADQARTISAS